MSIRRDGRLRRGRYFAFPHGGRFPAVRPGRFDGPGNAVLRDVIFPVEREGLDVVAKDEPVLAATSVFNFVGQAVELALVGIQFPCANEGIIGRERAGADKAKECAGQQNA